MIELSFLKTTYENKKMSDDFDTLITESKALSGLTPELEMYLKDIAPIVMPHLSKVTETFYMRLVIAPTTCAFLEAYMDKLDSLKATHLAWMMSLFTHNIDKKFAEEMRRVGDVHISIQLPIEFMSGAMSLVNKELIRVVVENIDDKVQLIKALQAINAVCGLSLIIMQKSYQLWD
jgi:hemoglobin-like flavoprotein